MHVSFASHGIVLQKEDQMCGEAARRFEAYEVIGYDEAQVTIENGPSFCVLIPCDALKYESPMRTQLQSIFQVGDSYCLAPYLWEWLCSEIRNVRNTLEVSWPS
jgi:hypothetical protein